MEQYFRWIFNLFSLIKIMSSQWTIITNFFYFGETKQSKLRHLRPKSNLKLTKNNIDMNRANILFNKIVSFNDGGFLLTKSSSLSLGNIDKSSFHILQIHVSYVYESPQWSEWHSCWYFSTITEPLRIVELKFIT